jgi:hypothetical protein
VSTDLPLYNDHHRIRFQTIMTKKSQSLASPDSQWTPPKDLAGVLKEAKADIENRVRKYPAYCGPNMIEFEIIECLKSGSSGSRVGHFRG